MLRNIAGTRQCYAKNLWARHVFSKLTNQKTNLQEEGVPIVRNENQERSLMYLKVQTFAFELKFPSSCDFYHLW